MDIKKDLSIIFRELSNKAVLEEYPEFDKLLEYYFKFLNDEIYNIIINITENNNVNNILSELLLRFYDQYFDLLDDKYYKLSDNNLRTFIEMAKWINNTKGNKNIYDFIINYLEGYKWVDPSTLYEYTVEDLSHSIEEIRPFEYTLTINQPVLIIYEFLQKVKPLGFLENLSVVLDTYFEGNMSITSAFKHSYTVYFETGTELFIGNLNNTTGILPNPRYIFTS
ncbi:hypothetical protein [uncultured Arcobacter sp.]|uniref:hypothetical protein n=1 Tax=uncultured Arcobacter sp. TaxID=165434 RepID=UPI00262368AD|nr:hypothetical protein [uncultured Arcobacter sp.]